MDAQRIVSDYLRTAVSPTRVVSKPPAETNAAWVQIAQQSMGRNPQDPTHHLRECYFQVDCYASESGGLPEAMGLSQTVGDAIIAIAQTDHDGAVVTAGVLENAGFVDRDPDLTDANGLPRSRVVITATVFMHDEPT